MVNKLAYLGTQVSPNQLISKHGYLVCMNVPICRTGTQDYLGSELEGHPGYDPEWGLDPNTRYPVLRSLEEVTDPATVASFEGNSVVDEHPDSMLYPGSLVTVENDGTLNRGHAQHIRVGEPLPESGEIPLLADLHIKNMGLIQKIDGGIKEISCGYTFRLVRLPEGRLAMTKIRGNHVAVVPNGRAGGEVAIGDAELPQPVVPKEKTPMINVRKRLIGMGLIAAASAQDAKPEDIAELAAAAKDEMEPDAEPPTKAEKDKAAKDKMAKDAEDEEERKKKAAEDADEHPKGCRCDDCKPGMKDKAAKDKGAKDAPDLEDLKDDDMPPKAEVINDEADPELKIDETGDHVLKTALDSSRALIQVLKPLMGSGTQSKAVVDAYNTHVRALNAAKGNPYAKLIQVQKPVLATDSAVGAGVPIINPRSFFEGRTHQEGMKAYQEHLAKGGK